MSFLRAPKPTHSINRLIHPTTISINLNFNLCNSISLGLTYWLLQLQPQWTTVPTLPARVCGYQRFVKSGYNVNALSLLFLRNVRRVSSEVTYHGLVVKCFLEVKFTIGPMPSLRYLSLCKLAVSSQWRQMILVIIIEFLNSILSDHNTS